MKILKYKITPTSTPNMTGKLQCRERDGDDDDVGDYGDDKDVFMLQNLQLAA